MTPIWKLGEWRFNGEQNQSPLVTDQMESSLALHHFVILLMCHPKMEILDLDKNEPEKPLYHILWSIVPLIL